MLKLGRNDPCHCGSGKKYKKCCMNKDKEAAQAEQAARQAAAVPVSPSFMPALPETPPKPPDPLTEARNARWEDFQAAGYEGQIALFDQILTEESELMDGEMAFEFLNDVYYESVERNERDRFEAMADALLERLPEVYAAEARFILGWRITNALAAGRAEEVPALAEAMAATAEKNIDEFFNLMDQLAYHNQLAALVSATRLAWPQVKDSTRIFGIDDFARQAADYVIFNYLSQTSTPDDRDPDLLAQIAPYITLDLDLFTDYIARLTHQRQHPWTLADFEFGSPPPTSTYDWDDEDDEEEEKPVNEGRQNLHHLTVEFLGYLYHQESVPYAKGELARFQIHEYILKRHDGDLDPPESRPKPIRGKKHKSNHPSPQHPLCPDRKTLDHFLADLINFFNPQYYKAAATLELTPAWLRFLESRGLITTEQREQTLADLRGLDTEFGKVVKTHSDLALRTAMDNWRSQGES